MSRGLEVSRSELVAKGYTNVRGVWCPPATFELPTPTTTVARFGTAPNNRPYKSKWESEYAIYLSLEHRAGNVRAWQYEAVTLLIGIDVRYTPDFVVIPNPGRDAAAPQGVLAPKPQLHEVKGHWRDDAKSKFRVAAMAYPWLEFRAVTRKAGHWETLEQHNA